MLKYVALEIDLICLVQCQKMGGIMSNFSKLDSIINPETPSVSEEAEAEAEAKNESTIETTDSTATAPIEQEVSKPKELEPGTTIYEKLESKEEISKEKLPEGLPKDGKKVEVEPVDISKMTDVIKKSTRKRKRHQME